MKIVPIAHIKSPYPTKFGVPRQPRLVPSVVSFIEFNEDNIELLDALDLHQGDALCVLWSFSYNEGDASKWSKTIRPPLLGGTKRVGVFASRSSFRPNNLALSIITVDCVSNNSISFRGADMVDGTPVFALFPFEQSFHEPEANAGWQSSVPWPEMERVVIPRSINEALPGELRAGLTELLKQDPRPAYTRTGQEQRSFWVALDSFVLWFQVHDRTLVVTSVDKLNASELALLKRSGNILLSSM